MKQDWRFRSMWDWRGIEDEFFSHMVEVGGGVIHDACVHMEIDDDLMIFVRWIMEPDWREREKGSEEREEQYINKTRTSLFLIGFVLWGVSARGAVMEDGKVSLEGRNFGTQSWELRDLEMWVEPKEGEKGMGMKRKVKWVNCY